MIVHGLRSLLLTQLDIMQLIQEQTIGRVAYQGVFCDSAVQNFKPPYVVITQTGGDPMLTLDDYSETLKSVELDIDTYHRDAAKARTIDRMIRQFLDDYTGACGSDDTIKAVLFDEPVWHYENPMDGSGGKFCIVSTSYMIQYSTP